MAVAPFGLKLMKSDRIVVSHSFGDRANTEIERGKTKIGLQI